MLVWTIVQLQQPAERYEKTSVSSFVSWAICTMRKVAVLATKGANRLRLRTDVGAGCGAQPPLVSLSRLCFVCRRQRLPMSQGTGRVRLPPSSLQALERGISYFWMRPSR